MLGYPIEKGSVVNKFLKDLKIFSYLKMTITNESLSAKVGTKFRQQVAVPQSVWFACRLNATEFVFVCIPFTKKMNGHSISVMLLTTQYRIFPFITYPKFRN
jgi:hypothetical protein